MLAVGWGWCGCATPLRMELARQSAAGTGDTVWWVVDDPIGRRPPIVGIEHVVAGARSRQTVLTDQGVRVFEYQGCKLVGSSAPLPDAVSQADWPLVRWVLRNAHEKTGSGVPRQRLPTPFSHAAESMRDVVALLERQWSEARTHPPAGWSYRSIHEELLRAPVGVSDLLAASASFEQPTRSLLRPRRHSRESGNPVPTKPALPPAQQ